MALDTIFAPSDGNVHGRWVENDDGAQVVREQYVGDIRDYCIARHNEGHHGDKDMKLMASFPAVVIEHYCNVNGITFREWMNNPEHVKRMVNDPALADFRIAPGRM
jgi:hypothetical protein